MSECWDGQKISSFAFDEMDGCITFSFKDAVSCEPIKEAKISVNNKFFKSDSRGYIKFKTQYIDSIMGGTIELITKKDNYCTFRRDIKLMAGTIFKSSLYLEMGTKAKKSRFASCWTRFRSKTFQFLNHVDIHYENLIKIMVEKYEIVVQKA